MMYVVVAYCGTEACLSHPMVRGFVEPYVYTSLVRNELLWRYRHAVQISRSQEQ